MKRLPFYVTLAALVVMGFSSCKKEENVTVEVEDNDAPYYDGISTIVVENYVNRLFIDLIGREPVDAEMEAEVAVLRAHDLSFESRDSLAYRLQFDEAFVKGDTSYKNAYYKRLYELFKVRLLEGASDADVQREIGLVKNSILRDSIAGDALQLALHTQQYNKLANVLLIHKDLMEDQIEVKDAFARLLNNNVYDRINMNTFNFLRASFNDLFNRFPTPQEFNAGYDIVEYDIPGIIFSQEAGNKTEFIGVLVNTPEFYEGMVRWTYVTLMARDATTDEVSEAMETYFVDHDLQKLQRQLLITDEYANFRQ